NAPSAIAARITARPSTASAGRASLRRSARMPLHQHDVELIRRIRALALEPARLTGQLLELRDARRLLVEEPLDHVRPREHEHLLEIELPVLSQDLAEDLVTDRLRRLHEAPAFAARARLTEQVLEALAGALARHLDEPER